MSTDSNTALDEALSESKELRAKHEKLLRKLAEQENKSKRLQGQLAGREEEVFELRDELAALRGPFSDLSSGNYQTPLSCLSEGPELEQPTAEGQNGGGLLMRLQTECWAKSKEITKLKQAITQLKRRLDYAEDLEKQTTRLITEASVHEQEKIELQEQVEKLQQERYNTKTEFSALQEHFEQQSKQVMKLRSHIDAAKVSNVLLNFYVELSKQLLLGSLYYNTDW